MDNNSHDTPSPDEQKAARRALMLHNLDIALAAAQELRRATTSAFPEAAAEVDKGADKNLENLSTDQRIALGNAAADDLSELAFNLDPSSMMDRLEPELSSDSRSLDAATAAILKAQAPIPGN